MNGFRMFPVLYVPLWLDRETKEVSALGQKRAPKRGKRQLSVLIG